MSVVLFLTNTCNLKCKYCFVPKCQKYMTLETYIKVINDLKDETKNLTFFGGEPLLCFNLIKDIISYNEKNNIKLSYNLNTNALLLKEEILDYCIEKDMLLNVSLDGNKESNLINRCNEKEFNIVLNNIKKAISLNGKVIVNYVIDPSNIKHYYESIKFLISNNINEICLMINYEALWKKKDIDLFKQEHNKVIDLLLENDQIKIHPLESKIDAISDDEEVRKCKFGEENVVVNTEGKYYPCMGFVDNNNYLIEKKNQKFENTVDIKKCLNCKFLKYCSHNCMCKYTKLDPNSEVDANCEFEKIFISSATNYIIKKVDKLLEDI